MASAAEVFKDLEVGVDSCDPNICVGCVEDYVALSLLRYWR